MLGDVSAALPSHFKIGSLLQLKSGVYNQRIIGTVDGSWMRSFAAEVQLAGRQSNAMGESNYTSSVQVIIQKQAT